MPPCPLYYYHHHAVAAAVLRLLCAAAFAAPGTGRTTTATGVVGPLPPSSVVDDSRCLRWCGDVYIPYPFGAGPADSCSVSPELRLHCNDTGNGIHKLFLGHWQDGMDSIEVVDIDVIQGQMRVVSQIFYSCFNNAEGCLMYCRSRTASPAPATISRSSGV
ncbi:hypothetical protein BS78_05G258900 [Paspalum vaginatum]|nr:hypothetical protein BS78_05G258900 [Paspalum vaginatum]